MAGKYIYIHLNISNMSKFSKYFIKQYPGFRENVLKGNYKEALSIYAEAYLKMGEGKKVVEDYWRLYSAAYDGLHRHNSTREQDLREWIADDRAFNGFMEYFRTLYGKNGKCRVSNKLSKEVKSENRMDKFLRKRQLIDFIKLNIKNGILDKQKLFEEAKNFIQEYIVSRRLEEFKRHMKIKVAESIKVVEAIEPIEELNLLLYFQWVYDNVDNAALHCMEDYLLWYAARYINKKGIGKNIPTNTLTASLKANPLLYVLMLLITREKDVKKFLQSFRYQKRTTYTESMNYMLLSATQYRLDQDDALERIKTSKVVSGPKTFKDAKELLVARDKYQKYIIDYYWRARPTLDFVDKRLADAIIEVLKSPRLERLLPKQREFLESLPAADASTEEQCIKVFNRIVGIYTFSTRVKNISRRDYYDYYGSLMVRDKHKKEKKWVKLLDETLDVFIPSKEYSSSEYEYVNTENGYILARYDCSGNLCMGATPGNYVRKVKEGSSLEA